MGHATTGMQSKNCVTALLKSQFVRHSASQGLVDGQECHRLLYPEILSIVVFEKSWIRRQVVEVRR